MSRDERLPSADRGGPSGFDSSFEEEVSRRFSTLSKAAEEVSSRRKKSRKSEIVQEKEEQDASNQSREERDDLTFDQKMRVRGSARKDMRTVVYLEQIKAGSDLRNMLSKHVTWLLIAQVAIVNIGFLVMVYWGALCERWPSDRLVLGWFASTVVEMFALYAIVLRGVFPGNGSVIPDRGRSGRR